MSTPVGSYASLDQLPAQVTAADASPGFSVIGPTPKVTFSTQNVPPPSPLYVVVTDVLLVTVSNINPLVTSLPVTWRVLTPEGEIKYASDTILVSRSDGGPVTKFLPLAEGFLLSVQIALDTGVTQRGECFVSIDLCKGPAESFIAISRIANGYVVGLSAVAWPGNPLISSTDGSGSLQTLTTAVPNPGAFVRVTVSPLTRWKLGSMVATLTTSAAAGNRVVQAVLTAAGGQPYVASSPIVQGSSTTVTYMMASGINPAVGADGLVIIPFTLNITLFAGWRFQLSQLGVDAADQWTAGVCVFEQWVVPQ